jgi:hypothetical protein
MKGDGGRRSTVFYRGCPPFTGNTADHAGAQCLFALPRGFPDVDELDFSSIAIFCMDRWKNCPIDGILNQIEKMNKGGVGGGVILFHLSR